MKPDLGLRGFIATKVMGWRYEEYVHNGYPMTDLITPDGSVRCATTLHGESSRGSLVGMIPAYELSIEAAMQVDAEMFRRGWRLRLDRTKGGNWDATYWREGSGYSDCAADHARAICLAAKSAIEAEGKQ